MSELSLRDRKYASTKADLMNAVLARLSTERLADIKVRDICDEVMVSEPTFFNYFPSKTDVIVYRIQLWSIEVLWNIDQQLQQGASHLDAIRHMFAVTAQVSVETPGMMAEIVAYQALQREKMSFTPLKPAEYAHHFPDNPAIENISAQGINQILANQVQAAHHNGELPSTLNLEALTLTLMSIFFLTPVMAPQDTADVYQNQLGQLLPN